MVQLRSLGESNTGITIFLADSVVGVRQRERTLLEKEPDMEVVGEASDEPEAMMLIKSLEPQVVLTDFNIRPTGFFAKQIKSQHPKTKVLGVTELKGRYVRKFVKIFGPDELLDRNDLETALITTVRLVAQA